MHELVTRLDAKPELRLVPYTFERAYGHAPAGVWTAPYAVRLAGHDVAVAVQWQVIVAASPRDDGRLRLASLNRPAEWVDAGAAEVPAWARAPYAALRNAAVGADVLVHADLPPVAGLSADLPLACAAVLAGTEAHGAAPSRDRVAELVPVGPGQESVRAAILAGRPAHAVRTVDGSAVRVPFDLRPFDLRMMLIVTRAPEAASRPAPKRDTGRLVALLNAGETALAALSLTFHDPGGPPETVAAVDGALAAGALAAWPHGGAVIAVLPAATRPAVRAAVTGAFRERGLRLPRFLNLTVAGAARRQN